MAKDKEDKIIALGKKAAYNLADVNKTKPQYGAITPKWVTRFLEFKGLDSGIYRVNKVKATPHNHRLPPLPHICLQIFRHIA